MVSKVLQWGEGEWSDTVCAVGIGSKLYSVERDGTLHATHTVSGDSKQIGEGYKTRLLVANGTTEGELFAIEKNGNLYRIDRKTGDWEALSEDGDWSDTVAADASGNKLVTVERDGTVYVTDLDNFDEDSEVLDDGYDTKAMWIWDEHAYVLENDGSLYKVNLEDGECERFGDQGAYSDTVAATIHDGVFYAVEDDGALGATSL